MANTKPRHWHRRLDQGVRVLLAAAMTVQLAAGGLSVAFAAENEDLENPVLTQSESNEPAPQTEGGNLLANGTFTHGSGTIENGVASTTIVSTGDDWTTMIVCPTEMDASYEYEISATLTSTSTRTIAMSINDKDNPRDFISEGIPENTETTVSFVYKNEIAGEKTVCIYLGLNGDAFPGEHTVTISNVSVVKGDKIKLPGEDTEDGAPVEEVAGNLLKNGNFAGKGEGWEKQDTNADVYFNAYRTVFYLKGSAADWQQGLKQSLTLSSGTKYRVNFTVETSVARTVSVNLRDVETDNTFVSGTIPAGEATQVSFVTDGAARDGGSFFLYLGDAKNVTYPHSVVISDISAVEIPVELPDTANDTAPAEITSIQDTTAADMTVLKDGNFTQGLAKWETWAEDWINQYNSVSFVPAEGGGMTVEIRADVAGNNPWSIQLNQKVNLKAGLDYTISFDVETDKDRAFNVVIDQLGAEGFVKPVAVRAGQPRHVVLNVPQQSEDALNKTFSFQLGLVSGNEKPNTNITFKNVKIEVNGYSEKAVLVPDGDFTNDFGAFTASAVTGSKIEVNDGSVIASIVQTEQTKARAAVSGNTLTRSITGMESGVDYTLSFMAGAVDEGSITVTLPNGESKTFALTDDAKLCTVDFTATDETGDLAFDFGTDGNIICLDTVRLDAKGYAAAAGVNAEQHDITCLTKNAAPLLSEMALAEFGKDVVLTFAPDADYEAAINSVTLDGKTLSEGDYTVGSGTITLNSSLFTNTTGSDRQTYNITVSAYWYEDNHATQLVYTPGVFTATWADEFNDNALDETKWGYQDGTGAEYGLDGWGNNEQQYYTRNNLTVGDGAMTITATQGTHGKPYDSARIWTQNQAGTETYFRQTYGRFEAKMKLPAGDGCQGLWPAFWLLPVDTSIYGGWPLSGEIDIMEARGREGNKADGTIHFGRPWPNDGASGSTMVWDDPLAITDYHIYSVDWTPTYMSFQVDGQEYYRAENWYSQSEDQPAKYAFPAPFDQDFYIIFNMAVGGSYDGNRNPDASVLPAEMKVDYVRVYQFNDLPNGIVADPDVTPEEIPAGAKGSIIDPDFTDVKKVVSDSDPKNVDGWNLLALSQFGGAADFETVTRDGSTFSKVDITNGGNANYSVQLTQKLALYYGNWYTLSFDACADSPREIIAKIGGDGTNSWAAYNSATTALTREVRHYEYTFQMLNTSDPSSRLEMNMGFGTGPVYIGNVEFKSAAGLTINPDAPKTPLEDGSCIYNGAFDLGNSSRLAYWHADGGAVGKVGNGYHFQANRDHAALHQTGIELLQSDTYRLSADVTGAVTYTVASAGGQTTYASGTLNAAQEFTMPAGVTDKNATVTFTLDNGATLDNISLVRTTFHNVDYSGLDCYPLVNGDFENGTLGWGTYGTTLNVAEDGSGHIGQVTSGGANRWDALLSQDLHLLGGYTYELSFKAKASQADAVFDLSMEDANYSRAFQQTNLKPGTTWTDYKYSFKFNADKDLSLKFLVGGGNFTLSLDDVELKIAGAPANPGAFVPNGYNRAGDAITVTYTGSEDWAEKAVLKLNGEVISSDKYTIEGGTLTLDASLFPVSGDYTLTATAEGYADSKAVTIRVYPADGDLIYNGSFDMGREGWETYIHGGSSATLDFTPGYLDARYLHAEGDEWGNPSVPWSIQLNQHFTVKEAGTHTLHFMASSEVARNIRVGLDGGKFEQFTLTNEWTEYAMDVTVDHAGSYQLMFQLGTVNPDAEGGYFPKDGFVDFEPHSFYLDHISLLPENSTYTGGNVPTAMALTGGETMKLGQSATVTAQINHPVDGESQPTGDVAFTLNGQTLTAENGTLTLDGSVLNAVGTYTIRAAYAGDDRFAPCEAAFTVTVGEAGAPDTPENPGTPGNSGGGNPGGGKPGRPSVPDTDIDDPDVPLTQPFVFVDVASGIWYYDAVKYVFDRGLMTGVSDTAFAPDEETTRGMIVTILHRMEKEPAAAISSFLDRVDGKWYTDAIDWAAESGVINGYDNGSFGADDSVTREQLVTILYRYAGMKGYDVSARASLDSYSDAAQVSGYAGDAMAWAVANGLVKGTSETTISPKATATRAQIALILMRFCGKRLIQTRKNLHREPSSRWR